MRTDAPFARLPVRVDLDALAYEVEQLPAASWRARPDGTEVVPLLSPRGNPEDPSPYGPMGPTPHLAELPYARQVLAGLGTVLGRARLVRTPAGHDPRPSAADAHYRWDRVSVHFPVVTEPAAQMRAGGATRALAAGEAWVVDGWAEPHVHNPGARPVTHLVVDTVGAPELWELVDRGRTHPDAAPRGIPNRLGADPDLPLETVNRSPVMTPWELDRILDGVAAALGSTEPGAAAELAALLGPIRQAWHGAWARHGDEPSGWATFASLRDDASRALLGLEGRAALPDGLDVAEAVRALVVDPAVAPDVLSATVTPRRRRSRRIERPVVLVAPPCSGSRLLAETLARAPGLSSIRADHRHLVDSLPSLAPSGRGWSSNRLTERDVTGPVVDSLHHLFEQNARDRDGNRPSGPLRILTFGTAAALQVPFLAELLPDATFVYLYRDARETVSLMLDAWRAGTEVTYPDLPGWEQPQWSFLLTDGWRDLTAAPLAEVVARQWATATATLLDDLEALPPHRWCVASFDRFVDDPASEVGVLVAHLGLDWDIDLTVDPPARPSTESPHPDRWRRNAEELEAMWDLVAPVARRAHDVFADPPRTTPVAPVLSADADRPRRVQRLSSAPPAPPSDAPPGLAGAPVVGGEGPVAGPAAPSTDAAAPLRSVHTKSLAALLQELGSSLLVSTYQSGRVIVVRPDGDRVNTHFRSFPAPMGMAMHRDLLALGTRQGVWVYQDQPAVGEKLEPKGRHDACYLPRTHHVTGDIRIHDIAFAGGELWIANTRFSCLATLDGHHSFVPRWLPPFITTLAAEDRCHLNGLAVVDDEVRYVSALGVSDEAGGWREHKASGGVVVDVPSGEVVLRGLSMPHSPRWHEGRLWILESGKGTIGVADLEAGTVDTVAHLPGFTRGLAFAGPYAFVGLSQVREHVFGGIPLTEDLDQRVCGVWVVDTRGGEVVGFLRFEGAVQEIYDVQLLAGRRWPEVVEPGAEVVSGSFVLSPEALALT